jgi:hypothetical protein
MMAGMQDVPRRGVRVIDSWELETAWRAGRVDATSDEFWCESSTAESAKSHGHASMATRMKTIAW